MPNMSLKKVAMPEQDPNVRNKNFIEVTLGYSEDMAKEEAQRCLQCKHRPCVQGCPVNIKIPDFIALVGKGDFEGAYKKVKKQVPFQLYVVGFALRRLSVNNYV